MNNKLKEIGEGLDREFDESMKKFDESMKKLDESMKKLDKLHAIKE